MAQVIFLHGASSSGKSTLARALQYASDIPFWHISIDHLRDSGVVPVARFWNGDFEWRDHRRAFFDGFHASLRAYVEAGNNLILEHILEEPQWLSQLQDIFADHNVCFVGVHCPLEVLVRRERTRGDRRIGSAAEDFHNIHKGLHYDIDVRGTEDVALNVSRILEVVRSGRRSSSFSSS
ncbi:MAG: AAA family ATPase [Rhodobacteraceae bacterium]|nr:AAA family ATPase [Paracoccaceae bacterium]